MHTNPPPYLLRSLCYFTPTPRPALRQRILALVEQLQAVGFDIQTIRVVVPPKSLPLASLAEIFPAPWFLSWGGVDRDWLAAHLDTFCSSDRLFCHLPIEGRAVEMADMDLLYALMRRRALKTFHFALAFKNVYHSPFFPTAQSDGQTEGFSLGFQTTDLAAACPDVDTWLAQMPKVWERALDAVGHAPDFLGLDASIAPLLDGAGSLVRHVARWAGTWEAAVCSPLFVRCTRFLAEHNPRPVGLNGLMLPCLEDFALAEAYEQGSFSTERNLFLSMHSGLGIDTYPIGTDQDPTTLCSVAELTRCLAEKHRKPLAIRWISDGQTKIGERTQFDNPYLREVVLRPI